MFVPRSCQKPICAAENSGARSRAVPSTMAVSTTCPTPERARDAVGEEQSAASEVADDVERRDRALPRPTDRAESAGERDVVDVVAGPRRERALLPPAGEPAVHQGRRALE